MVKEKTELIFLGMNQAGEEVYEWLNGKENVEVKALLTEKDQLSLIEELEPDVVVSSGFEHMVPDDIIKVPEKGIVNLHPSFLPYNRGSHPYIWPIIEDTPAGVSIHYMNDGIDEGPVIAKKEVRVEPEDTGKTLHERLMFEMVELFKDNWEEVRKGVEGREQDLNRGSTHRKEDLDEASKIRLEEEMKAAELIDRLRALSYPPHKTAYFERNGEKFYLNLEIERTENGK